MARSLGSVDVALRAGAVLGEGPRWDVTTSTLLWVDIERCAVHRFDPSSGADETVELDDQVAVAVPAESGGLLVALAGRLVLVADESRCELATIPHGRAAMRLNDGACDPAGRFWVGSLALDFEPGAGALYRYANGEVLRVLDGITLSNGIGWSPDARRMYYVDSLTYRVDVFDFDAASGEIRNRRPFVVLPRGSGVPDGLAVDGEGCVWLALYGRGRIQRYRSDGSLDGVLELPVTKVTACAFGGGDGRDLYITTAAHGLNAEELVRQPLAGAVFVSRVDAPGPPARPFAG